MTRRQMLREMPSDEYVGWIAYFLEDAEQKKKAARKAAGG